MRKEQYVALHNLYKCNLQLFQCSCFYVLNISRENNYNYYPVKSRCSYVTNNVQSSPYYINTGYSLFGQLIEAAEYM